MAALALALPTSPPEPDRCMLAGRFGTGGPGFFTPLDSLRGELWGETYWCCC